MDSDQRRNFLRETIRQSGVVPETMIQNLSQVERQPGEDDCDVLERFGLIAPGQSAELRAQSQRLRAQSTQSLVNTRTPGNAQTFSQRFKLGEATRSLPGVQAHYAEDQLSGRSVIVKSLLQNASEADQRRFQRSIEIYKRLAIPGVISLLEFGTTRDGIQFATFQAIPGQTFQQLLAIQSRRKSGGRVRDHEGLGELLQILVKVAEIVAGAHARGFVHRDLCPANILISESGQVLVLGWELARKLSDSNSDPCLQSAGLQPAELRGAGLGEFEEAVLGTPGYIAPEQIRGLPCDCEADVFSLGVLLIEAMLGRPAIAGEEPMSRLRATLDGDIERVQADARVPERLRELAEIASEPEVQQRLGSARSFAHQLNLVLAMQELELTTTKGSKASVIALAVLLFVVTLASGFGFVWTFQEQSKAQESAASERRRGDELAAKLEFERALAAYSHSGDKSALNTILAKSDFDLPGLVMATEELLARAAFSEAELLIKQNKAVSPEIAALLLLEAKIASRTSVLERPEQLLEWIKTNQLSSELSSVVTCLREMKQRNWQAAVDQLVENPNVKRRHVLKILRAKCLLKLPRSANIELETLFSQAEQQQFVVRKFIFVESVYRDRLSAALLHVGRLYMASAIDPEVTAVYALLLAKLKRTARALSMIEAALQCEPDNARFLVIQGIIYSNKGDGLKARESLTRALELNPESALAASQLAQLYDALGQSNLAREYYDKAIRLHPNDSNIYNNRGNHFALQRSVEAAIKDYGRAIDLNPGLSEARYNRANLFAEIGRVDDALRDLGVLISKDPRDEMSLILVAKCYLKLGNYRDALRHFEKVLVVNPVHEYALRFAGSLCLMLNKVEKSRGLLERGLRVNPKSAEMHFDLATIHFNDGDYTGARRLFTRSMKLGGPQVRCRIGVVRALIKLGLKAEARSEYEVMVKLPLTDSQRKSLKDFRTQFRSELKSIGY